MLVAQLATMLQLASTIYGSGLHPLESMGATLRQCLVSQTGISLGRCLGVGAISELQSIDASPEFDLVDGVTLTRNGQEYRDNYNFADGDPSSFRTIVDSFGHVFSKRNMQWDMAFLYPGLAMRVSPSVSTGGILEFVLDQRRESLNVHSLKEAGTGRLLARSFLLPFLLGFKFNMASLVPILFGVLALFAKKAVVISKLALVITSALALGSLLLGSGPSYGYETQHYSPNYHQGLVHGGGGIHGAGFHGYSRYPEEEYGDSLYRGMPEQQTDQLKVFPDIAKSIDTVSAEEVKTTGRNFAWDEKEKKN